MSGPALIALDWGTTTLRAVLLDDEGRALESRTEPWGAMRVADGGFASAFRDVTSAWRAATVALPAIAAGMVGSTQGWVQAPYCDLPADVDALASALTATPEGALWIVPGIAKRGAAPDVMRGEETQVAGALAIHPELVDSLLVFPGTHSKWVRVRGGSIVDFTTSITGELFAVLRDHSILGRLAPAGTQAESGQPSAAFTRGVAAARDAQGGLASLLFTSRSMVLTGQLDASESLEYLSGLVIGDELRHEMHDGQRPSALIGDVQLCARYAAAMELFGVRDVPVVDGAAQAGLWSIACKAGLMQPAATHAE